MLLAPHLINEETSTENGQVAGPGHGADPFQENNRLFYYSSFLGRILGAVREQVQSVKLAASHKPRVSY